MLKKKNYFLFIQNQTRKGLLAYYIANSSIHGVKYLRRADSRQQGLKQKSNNVQCIFWALALTVSLICFIVFVVKLCSSFERGPIAISHSEKAQPIWNIPYPAVTICPETKAKSKLINFTDVYHIMNEQKQPPYNVTQEV